MSEEIPFIILEMEGGDFEATPDNAELFTFVGQSLLDNGDIVENSSRNHVFLRTGEHDAEVVSGHYVFAPDVVQRLGAVMLNYGFPARLNQRHLQECDEAAYQKYIDQQFVYEEDFESFPEDWSDGTK